MIRRRAAAAGISEAIGCHTFRATGITAYLANGGALVHAQALRPHEGTAYPGRDRTDQVMKASFRTISVCSCGDRGSFEKEAQHFTTCIRSPGVSVGPTRAPARPGVPGSM